MEHQYPVAITGDEHMLAELMLPDQAHVRNQDWTIFFLHKDTSQDDDDEAKAKAERRKRRKRRRDRAAGILMDDEKAEADAATDDDDDSLDNDEDDDSDDDSTASEPEGGEGPPLIYVLNLVNTKQDKTVKRGAVVKAMAICTRHPFLHIYKVCPPMPLPSYALARLPGRLDVAPEPAVADMGLATAAARARGVLQVACPRDTGHVV